MHHSFVDIYADLDTPLHKIDPKKKIVFLAVFLLAVILTPIKMEGLFLLYGMVAAGLVHISKIPLRFIIKRLLEIIPFVIVISLSLLFKKGGGLIFLGCAVKAALAVLLVLLISSTTKFNELLQALRELRLPKLLIDLLSFMYRYSFLLEDRFLMAKRAYESRNAGGGSNFTAVRILSNVLGSIFIRTYERAERIYLAMCARGYDGK